MSRPDQGELKDRKLLYCIFCKEISAYKTEQHKEYKNHLEIGHKVSNGLMNVVAINFLGKNEKIKLIEQAKKCTERGAIFNCVLFYNVEFVVGEFIYYKNHLNKTTFNGRRPQNIE